MAELLLEWLNSLPLSRRVTSLERDFASGYMLAEVLFALKQLESLAPFVDSSSPHAQAENFRLLAPVFRRLDVRCDSRIMAAVLAQQEGAALRLLFQLKLALSRFSRNGGRAPADLARINAPAKPVAFEAFQAKFIDSRLKNVVKPRRGLSQEPAKAHKERECGETSAGRAPFEGAACAEEDAKAGRSSAPASGRTAPGVSPARAVPRSDASDKALGDGGRVRTRPAAERGAEDAGAGAARRGGSAEATRHGSTERGTRERKELEAEILRRKLLVEARVKADRQRKAAAKLQATREEMQKGIESFEMNLQRRGLLATGSASFSAPSSSHLSASLETNATQTGASPSTSLPSPPAAASVGASVRPRPSSLDAELLRRLPSASACRRENAEMMARLRASRSAQEIARREREKRRQKLLLEQTQAHADLAAEAITEKLVGNVFRRLSRRAEAVEEAVRKVRQLEEVLTQNRALRDSRVASQREKDSAAHEARAEQVALEAQEKLRRDVQLEAQQCREWKRRMKACKRARLVAECGEIVDLLLELVAAASQFHRARDAAIDPRTWREWLTGFTEGSSPFAQQTPAAAEKKAAVGAGRAASRRGADLSEDARAEKGACEGDGERGEAIAADFEGRPLAPGFAFLRVPSPPRAEVERGARLLPQDFPHAEDAPLEAKLNQDTLVRYINALGEFDPEANVAAAPEAFAFSSAPGASAAAASASTVSAGEGADAEGEPERSAALDRAAVLKELLRRNDACGGAAVEGFPQGACDVSGDAAGDPAGDPAGDAAALSGLGGLVGALLESLHTEAPCAAPGDLPAHVLKIVVTGKPFAGKKTLARKLAHKYRLHVLSLEEILAQSMHAAPDFRADEPEAPRQPPPLASHAPSETLAAVAEEDAPEQSPPAELASTDAPPRQSPACSSRVGGAVPAAAPLSSCSLSELRARACETLRSGEKLSDSLSVELLVAKVKQLFAATTPASVARLLELAPIEGGEAGVKAEKASGGKGKLGRKAHAPERQGAGQREAASGSEEEAEKKLGWILVGFPQTYEQCVSLEERLSGYVAPDRRPANALQRKKERASLVVPIPQQPPVEATPIEGGVDLHFHLEVSTEEAVLRARSAFQSPGVHEKLVARGGAESPAATKPAADEALRAPAKLSVAAECCHLDIQHNVSRAFLQRFGSPEVGPRLVVLPATSETETMQAASEKVELALARKRKALANAASSEEPVKAEQLSRDEVAAETQEDSDAGAMWRERVNRLEDPVKHFLLAQWRALERDYTSVLARVFSWNRRTRTDFGESLVALQLHFIQLLEEPDGRQELVNKFLVDYNAFVAELSRSLHLDRVKEELHQRVEDLVEALWQEIDARRSDAANELLQLAELQWINAICECLAVQTEGLVEAEIQRYLALEAFATDAYYNLMGACMPERRKAPADLGALREASQAAAQQAVVVFFKPKQEGAESPAPRSWQTHLLENLEANAWEHLVPLADFEDYIPNIQETDKKKPAKAKVPKKEPKPRALPSLFSELQRLRLELQVQLVTRVRSACIWGSSRLFEAANACGEVFAHMSDWLVAKSLAEHAAVKELATRLKICIENEKPVPHYMQLEGTQLLLDPNAVLCAPPRLPAPVFVPEVPADLFTVKQLRELTAELKQVTTNGLVSTIALREILLRRLTQSKCFLTPHFPRTWLSASVSQICLVPEFFDISGGCVDPLEFLLSLALGSAGWPDTRQLLQLRSSVSRASTLPLGSGGTAEGWPLEELVSADEFSRLDFSDWIPVPSPPDAGGAAHATAPEDAVFEGDAPASGCALVELLFEIFVAFQTRYNVRACAEDIRLLRELEYWRDPDTTTAAASGSAETRAVNPPNAKNAHTSSAAPSLRTNSSRGGGFPFQEEDAFGGSAAASSEGNRSPRSARVSPRAHTPLERRASQSSASGHPENADVNARPAPRSLAPNSGADSPGLSGADAHPSELGGAQELAEGAEASRSDVSEATAARLDAENRRTHAECQALNEEEKIGLLDEEERRNQAKCDSLYVRRFIGYLSLGTTPEDGLERFLAACTDRESLSSPSALRREDSLALIDVYTACLSMGVRPALEAVPLPAQIPFGVFKKRLHAEGRVFITGSAGEENGDEASRGSCEAERCKERVKILDFLESSVAAETLARVGSIHARRDVNEFLNAANAP
ncbi:hypothetical protein BESB_082300 [Besnoitia besnoiti]|uniref:Calponin-homology (CH) domain-containing protein n=1 Tax=Besnoitia besnoiti TaxID=94643 RepID=A0A2A9M9N8_BESBE|nr:hypothetical protein BESB_082300 [Besnoitia besnoiti]PFH33031.1 hypothetical protein BESB_082300 [Besnoitia besnoiti]